MKQINSVNEAKEEKKLFKQIWWFLWEDDSFLSWFVNLVLAFLIVKFILYPGLGLILGTDLPVVAVVSGSMVHEDNFDAFWNQQSNLYLPYGITKEKFSDFIFKNGFNKGDLIILYSPKNIEVGDVIVFQASEVSPIIHRVVKINNGVYTTKGDHNLASRQDEQAINKNRILGKAVFRLPFLGWFKIIFGEFLGLFGIHVN